MYLLLAWYCYINYCSWKVNKKELFTAEDELLHNGKYILFGTFIELFKLTKELTKKAFL